MVAESKASVAARFAAFAFPSAADFGNLIDSYTDYGGPATTLNLALAAHSGGGGRIISYSTSAAATVWSAATAGMYILGAATTGAAVSRLGAGAVGSAIFSSTTEAFAQIAMGGGTVGRQLFETTTTASAASILSVMATASQAQMEAASTGAVAVTPDVLKYHPAVPKVWLSMDGLGEASARSSYNISGVVRNGAGDYNASFTTPFSSNRYCVISRIDISADANNDTYTLQVVSAGVSTVHFRTIAYSTGSLVDCEVIDFTIFGDQ